MKITEEDVMRHRKKKKKKSAKKSKHKHDYEDVILQEQQTIYGLVYTSFCAGRRCRLCGKLGIGFNKILEHPVSVSEFCDKKVVNGITYSTFKIKPEFLHLPVVEIQGIFNLDKGSEISDSVDV